MESNVKRIGAEWHAEQISESWRSSTEGIIETGRRIAAAKAELPHGEFGRMCEELLPFGVDTAQRLMAISRNSIIANTAHGRLLPPSWRTLYELSRIDEPTLTGWRRYFPGPSRRTPHREPPRYGFESYRPGGFLLTCCALQVIIMA